jgi:hypothetical protein
MTQSPSLRMDLKPSWLLAGALAPMHVLALAAASITLSGGSLALVVAGIVLSGVVTSAGALLRTAGSARALELHADGRCGWRDRGGRWHDGRLHGQQFASPLLTVLGVQGGAPRRKWIVLLPDSADRDSLRRLRGWLRWRGEALAPDAQRKIATPVIEQ